MSYQQTNQTKNEIGLIIFKNNFKKGPKEPDMTGSLTFPDGKEMEVSLWTKTDRENDNYLAGNVKEKWIKPEGYVSKREQQPTGNVVNRVKIDF